MDLWEYQWWHQGGHTLSQRLCPHLPPQSEEKVAKISHFRPILGFFPPQNRILLVRQIKLRIQALINILIFTELHSKFDSIPHSNLGGKYMF